jgi:hypothetical protein
MLSTLTSFFLLNFEIFYNFDTTKKEKDIERSKKEFNHITRSDFKFKYSLKNCKKISNHYSKKEKRTKI